MSVQHHAKRRHKHVQSGLALWGKHELASIGLAFPCSGAVAALRPSRRGDVDAGSQDPSSSSRVAWTNAPRWEMLNPLQRSEPKLTGVRVEQVTTVGPRQLVVSTVGARVGSAEPSASNWAV